MTINTRLLSTWTFPPDPRYLRNLKISRLGDALLYNWKLPAGVRIRESIKMAREEFLKKLYVATHQKQTTEAAAIFMRKIDNWILELRNYARTCPSIKPRFRKASELMIKHRSANLTYRAALKKFGRVHALLH